MACLSATKEVLGGDLLFEADDLDAAIELASRFRWPAWAARSRVRPIVER